MRASLFVACGPAVLAVMAAVACANSTNVDDGAPTDVAVDASVLADSAPPDADAAPEASAPLSTCSEAGWCKTPLPDVDLQMKDIYPLPGHAFAIAESPTVGVKVLEWDDARSAWTYIDDGTQNLAGLGRWAGRIWAANANEVYYGVSPSYVYSGTRSSPEAAWQWTRQILVATVSADLDDGNPAYWQRDRYLRARIPTLGVWGTSDGEVYAWFKNTIYRKTGPAGSAPAWTIDYVASDVDAADEQLFFLAAAGTESGDLWFSGGRARVYSGCGVLVRKTSAGYRKVADGSIAANYRPCTPRAGTMMLGGGEGWLTDIAVSSPGELVGLKGVRDTVRISVDGDDYTSAVATIPLQILPTQVLTSTSVTNALYSASAVNGDVWLGGVVAGGAGLVVRGAGLWDGGAYGISTISLNGTTDNRVTYRVRGTSNTNLWAIGARYAFHKTTP